MSQPEPEAESLARAIMAAMEEANAEIVTWPWSDPTILHEVVAFEFLADVLRKALADA
jgi:ribosomal protein S5